MQRRTPVFLAVALLVPPLVVVLATAYSYARGAPPFEPDLPMISLAASLAVGVAALAQLRLSGALRRLAVLVTYVPVMSALLWGLVYLAGCFHGDC